MKTTVNGKEIKLYKKSDIGTLFSKVVAELLNRGYIYNFAESSRGSQGEELKADLTNDFGNTVIRLYVERIGTMINHNYIDTVVVREVKYENCKNNSTLWNGDGEVLYEQSFYCISDYYRRTPVFVAYKEDFELIRAIKDERCKNKYTPTSRGYSNYIETPNARKVALNLVRREKWCKSVPLSAIKSIRKHTYESGKVYFEIYYTKKSGETYVSLPIVRQ